MSLITKHTNNFRILLLCCLFSILSSCANYKLHINRSSDTKLEQLTSQHEISERIYCIGDIGESGISENDFIEAFIQLSNENDYPNQLLLLGDNFNDQEVMTSNHNLIQLLKSYQGNIIAIHGENEWHSLNRKGLIELEDKFCNLIDSLGFKQDKFSFYPGNACGDIIDLKLNDDIVLVIVDSGWYLRDWDKEKHLNKDCVLQSRKQFRFNIENVLRKHRHKTTILVTHHPVTSYGQYGGIKSLKHHIFPFIESNDKLWIPLPVIGSMIPAFQRLIAPSEYRSNSKYAQFVDDLSNASNRSGSFIFISGHEHSLQYIFENRQHHIIAGSSVNAEPVASNKGTRFAYGHRGLSYFDIYKNGRVDVNFLTYDNALKKLDIVYSETIRKEHKTQSYEVSNEILDFEPENKTDSFYLLNHPVRKRSNAYNFWMGNNYKDLYLRKYELDQVNLDSLKGGLRVKKRGGGKQTNSLRLENDKGEEYALRSMTKDAYRTIPYPSNHVDIANQIVQQFNQGTHPFAPAAVSYLEKQANILHTNPEFIYVPKQKALGNYNFDFGNEVYLIEEHPNGDWENLESFGNSKKSFSTEEVEILLKKNDKYKIDQRAFLDVRLMDLIINDWDRHSDQWKWIVKEKGEKKYLVPIPRDRDQAFSNYDAFLLHYVRLFHPFLRQLKPFKKDIGNIKWAVWSNSYVDHMFLNELNWEQWKRSVSHLKETLSDSIIDLAISQMPASAKSEHVDIKEILSYRIDNLEDSAKEFYKLITDKIDIVGTDKKDSIQLSYETNGHIAVEIWRTKKSNSRSYYKRRFDQKEVSEINIYALGDDDVINLNGLERSSIRVRVVGGSGKDKYQSKEINRKNKVWVYDNQKNLDQLELPFINKSSGKHEEFVYEPYHFHYTYDFDIPLPLISFNPEEGVKVGLNYNYFNHGFKKNKFASRHRLEASIASATLGSELIYNGLFNDIIGYTDLTINTTLRSDRYTINYFGLGNNSFYDGEDFDFQRVRQSLVSINPALHWDVSSDGEGISIGPIFESSKISQTPNKYITVVDTELPNSIFERQSFVGVNAEIDLAFKRDKDNPSLGTWFKFSGFWLNALNAEETHFGGIETSLAFYQQITSNARIILASQFGGGARFGDYPFIYSTVLGGGRGLRGFRPYRFYGGKSFFHSTELRFKLVDTINSILPLSMGVMTGFDYGRVWLDGEASKKWHTSVGGGIWIRPVQLVVIQTNIYVSDEDYRISAGINFDF